MNKYKQEYLEYCEINKRLASNTIDAYRNGLNSYTSDSLSCSNIHAWIKALSASRGDRTVSLNIIIMKGFLKWLRRVYPELRGKVCEPMDIELPKIKKERIDIKETEFSIVDKCDEFLVRFLFDTGLRISEAMSVRYEDINGNKIIIRGKGGKIRTVFISEKIQEMLPQGEGKIFKFTPRTAQRIIAEVGEKLGIELWPHKLRHMFASKLLMNGANIYDVSKILGHSSVTTTEIYSHIGNGHLEEAYKRAIK
jgi:integrase/recombinase XerC